MSKEKIKWVPASRTSFSPTRPSKTWWFCVPEGEMQHPAGFFERTCGKTHTTERGAEIHCKRLNEGREKPCG